MSLTITVHVEHGTGGIRTFHLTTILALLDCLGLRVPSIIRILAETRCTYRSIVVTGAYWLTRSLDLRIIAETRCTYRSIVVTGAFWLTRSLDHPDLG